MKKKSDALMMVVLVVTFVIGGVFGYQLKGKLTPAPPIVVEPPPPPAKPLTVNEVIQAIAIVESGGDPLCVGDGGNSRGICQISKQTWKDMTKGMGREYSWDMAFDEAKNLGIARKYFLWLTERVKAVDEKELKADPLVLAIASYNTGWTATVKAGYQPTPKGLDYVKKVSAVIQQRRGQGQ